MDPKEDPSYKRLLSTDWCAKWIENPEYRLALIKPPPSKPDLEGAFLGRTLRTEDTIRAGLAFYKVSEAQIEEIVLLFDIGTGLNGLPGAAHGGVVATLLDEACGIFVGSLVGPDAKNLLTPMAENSCATIWPANTTATLALNITYLKFVTTPSVIAIRSRLSRRDGRKIFVNSQMENSDGQVLAKAEALFIVRRSLAL